MRARASRSVDVRPPARAVQLRPGAASSPTSSGSCAACTTCRRPACSSSTTPTCRSTSRRTGAATTVVQVWHAAGALKRFGLDTATPLAEPERTFLHRYYDAVVVGGEWTRAPYAAALRTPLERVLAARLAADRLLLRRGGAGRGPRARVLAAHPALAGRRVVALRADVPRPRHRQAGGARARRRAAPGRAAGRPRARPQDAPEPRPGGDRRPPASTSSSTRPAEINDLLAATDILITDYSSSIFEFALLAPADRPARRRPRRRTSVDPGLYLDYRTEMIGTQVVDTDGVIDAIADRPLRPDRLRRLHRAPARAVAGRRERALRRATSSTDGPGARRAR